MTQVACGERPASPAMVGMANFATSTSHSLADTSPTLSTVSNLNLSRLSYAYLIHMHAKCRFHDQACTSRMVLLCAVVRATIASPVCNAAGTLANPCILT